MNISRCMAACVVAIAAFATSAAAEPVNAYESTMTTGTTGNGKGRQTKQNFSLGLDFEVILHGITISRLGVWDDNGNGLLSPHSLVIYDLSGSSNAVLARIDTLPGTGVLEAGYRYFDLPTALTLPEGTLFSMVVYYPLPNLDSNGNSGPTPPSLGEPTPTFVGDGYGFLSNIGVSRFGFGNVFPTTLDTGPANRYHAGSFTYTPNPEPGTMILLSGALAAAGVWRRRRARRS